MHRTILPLFLVVLLFGGCSSDSDSPTGPDPGTLPDATATVDGAGGVLEFGGVFSLAVPPGAVSGETVLNLYRENTEPIEGATSTDVYRIEGLPHDLASPLTCRLLGQAEADSMVGLIGVESFVTSLQEMRVTWSVETCTDSLDWAIFELPAADPGTARDKSSSPIRLSAAQSIVLHVTDSGDFRIAWSPRITTADRVERLGSDLDDALAFYDDIGFEQVGFTRWPVSVIVKPMTDALGFWSPNPWRLGGHMAFDSGILSDPVETRTTAAHETLHFCQYFYDPRLVLARAICSSPTIWLEEATAVWIENFFADDPDYCSTARAGHELAPLDGIMTPASSSTLARHGYGMSSLIRYLAVDEGVDFVLDAFVNVAAGMHPVEALDAAVDVSLADEWRDFSEALVKGELYPDVTLETVLAYPTMTLLHAGNDADSTGTTPMAYPDLSGQPHPVTWSGSYTFPHDARLHLWCDGGECAVSVFGVKSPDTRDLLGHAYGPVVLGDLLSLQETYDQLIVLVTNQRMNPPNYDEVSALSLQARVRRLDTPEYSYDHGKILVRYEADWSNGSHVMYQEMTFAEVEGIFTGHSFSASWDSTGAGNVQYSGHVTATFDATDMHVLSWSAENYATWDEGSKIFLASGTELSDVSANALQYTGSQTGETVCASIDQLYGAYMNSDGEVTNELTGYTCNSGSYVTVLLYDQSR